MSDGNVRSLKKTTAAGNSKYLPWCLHSRNSSDPGSAMIVAGCDGISNVKQHTIAMSTVLKLMVVVHSASNTATTTNLLLLLLRRRRLRGLAMLHRNLRGYSYCYYCSCSDSHTGAAFQHSPRNPKVLLLIFDSFNKEPRTTGRAKKGQWETF